MTYTDLNRKTFKEYLRGDQKWTIQRSWQQIRRQTKPKHNTRCVGHHYAQANIDKVNKTWDLQQTIGGKDDPSIVLINFCFNIHIAYI